MSQGKSTGQQRYVYAAKRGNLLRSHPVLTPVLLLGCALCLAIVSVFADTFFPLLTMIGISSAQFCLSLALVLCISGILTSIIGMIELIDRYGIRTAMFPGSKEQGYVNRN